MCRPIHGWPTASLVTVDTNEPSHRNYRKKILNTSVMSLQPLWDDPSSLTHRRGHRMYVRVRLVY